jgi:hypothetical protein
VKAHLDLHAIHLRQILTTSRGKLGPPVLICLDRPIPNGIRR